MNNIIYKLIAESSVPNNLNLLTKLGFCIQCVCLVTTKRPTAETVSFVMVQLIWTMNFLTMLTVK